MPAMPGPDGFLLLKDDPRYAAHLLLNDFLVEEEGREEPHAPERRFLLPPPDLSKWKRSLKKRQLLDILIAALLRMEWLTGRQGELGGAADSQRRLSRILPQLYSAKLPFTETDLVLVLHTTAGLLGQITPYGPVEHVIEFLKRNDLTRGLCRALREFQGSLREENSVNQASMQQLRQRLHMLLWLDEWDPLDRDRCWSEMIRRDYRAMDRETRTKWSALLRHFRGDLGSKIPSSWAREAERLLGAVGPGDFRDRFLIWFSLFQSGEALPLSVPGSHVLKGLLWCATAARDAVVSDAALRLLDARWKQKRNVDKAMVALAGLLETMPASSSWEPILRLQESWGISGGQVERLLRKAAAELGVTEEKLRERRLLKPTRPAAPSLLVRAALLRIMIRRVPLANGESLFGGMGNVQVDGNVAIIQGKLHFYRLFLPHGPH